MGTWPYSSLMLAESARLPCPLSDHDVGRPPGGRGGPRDYILPCRCHRGRDRGQRGLQLRGVGGRVLRRRARPPSAGTGASGPAKTVIREHDIDAGIAWFNRHGSRAVLIGGPAPGDQDVHLAAGRDRGHACAAVRQPHHDRVPPVDHGAGRGGYAVGKNWESIASAFHGPTFMIAAADGGRPGRRGLALPPSPK